MNKCDVRTAEDALSYLLECSLATVADMAGKNNKTKSEYKRQILIAQTTYNWCVAFGADISDNREHLVVGARGSVELWAKDFE